MTKNRLEALSDGIIATIITIMVLEFKVPITTTTFEALIPLFHKFLSSSGFIYILVTLMWLIPDKRIEQVLENKK
jgi:uncharacterized membrane protein